MAFHRVSQSDICVVRCRGEGPTLPFGGDRGGEAWALEVQVSLVLRWASATGKTTDTSTGWGGGGGFVLMRCAVIRSNIFGDPAVRGSEGCRV